MTGPKSEDTRDWVAVRRAYEQSDETIKQICKRFGVTKGALENRYRRDHWVSRQANAASRRRSTLARLFAVLEGQVTKLANASGETLGDKEAKQLTELIKNLDKMSSMENPEASKGGPATKKDMTDMRNKLIKQLEEFKRR
jgi:hypothetical protein